MKRGRIIFFLGLIIAAVIAGIWMTRVASDTATATQTSPSVGSADRAPTTRLADLAASTSTLAQTKAQDEDQEAAKDRAAAAACRTNLVNWLKLHDDADSLMAAAVLSLGAGVTLADESQKVSTRTLLRHAMILAPSDASIRWLAVSMCDEKQGCNPTEDELALRAIDPKNALGWVGEVTRAANGEKNNLDAALHAMANTERLDLYWAESIARISRLTEAAPIAPPKGVTQCTRSINIEVFSAIASLAIPAFAPLVRSCKLPEAANRLADCRAVGAALRKGDTILVQAVGIAISRNVATPGSIDEQQLIGERRRLDWQLEQVEKFGERFEIDWQRLHGDNHTELQMMQSLLRENGVPLEPPTDWIPNSNR